MTTPSPDHPDPPPIAPPVAPQPRSSRLVRRKKETLPPIALAGIAAAVAIVIGLIIAAVIGTDAGSGNSIIGGLSISGSVEQQAVRQFLKENTHTGQWEEVRWWPAMTANTGSRFVRLKYRTENGFGASMIHDQVFQIKSGRANVAPEGVQFAKRSYFPD